MLLFYSNQCSHCTMLIETLKTLDKQKQVKLVSVDYLKSNQIIFDARITHVPAMLLPDFNKIIFGKEVFDHLLLPGKGVLLKPSNNTNTQSVDIFNIYESYFRDQRNLEEWIKLQKFNNFLVNLI